MSVGKNPFHSPSDEGQAVVEVREGVGGSGRGVHLGRNFGKIQSSFYCSRRMYLLQILPTGKPDIK